jgi:uncharacterized membrane protein YheB (UPF0754 family)
MKRTEPKMIINLNISDEEFEKKIELAVDKYIESILDSCANDKVTEAIKKYVDKKIDTVLQERRYDNASMINGKTLSNYIADIARPKVEAVISDTIAKCVSETLTSKFKI